MFDITERVDQYFSSHEKPIGSAAYPRIEMVKCIACGEMKPTTFKTAEEAEAFVDGQNWIDFICQPCEDAYERAQIERYEAGLDSSVSCAGN